MKELHSVNALSLAVDQNGYAMSWLFSHFSLSVCFYCFPCLVASRLYLSVCLSLSLSWLLFPHIMITVIPKWKQLVGMLGKTVKKKKKGRERERERERDCDCWNNGECTQMHCTSLHSHNIKQYVYSRVIEKKNQHVLWHHGRDVRCCILYKEAVGYLVLTVALV